MVEVILVILFPLAARGRPLLGAFRHRYLFRSLSNCGEPVGR